jgi:uncharacterized protein
VTGKFEVTVGLPTEWDDLVAGAPPSVSRRWIALGADRLGADLRIFALRSADGIVAAVGGVPLVERHPSPRVDPYAILSGRSSELGLIPDGPHPWSGLAVGDVLPTLLLMYPNYDSYPVGSGANDPLVAERLVSDVQAWCLDEGLMSISLLYAGDRAAALLNALRRAGATVALMTDTCILDVTWPDLDGYIHTLPARWRGSVRKELARMSDSGVRLGVEDLDIAEPEVLALRGNLVAKYGGNPSPEKGAHAIAQVRTYFSADEVRLFTARSDDRLLNFALMLKDGSTWTAFMTGSDYADPRSRYGYFAVTYYQPAAAASALGIERIIYGLGSWEAKRLRGCRMEPLWAASLRLNEGPSGGGRR